MSITTYKTIEEQDMASKPLWACVTCGMYSSRKGAVKRHILRFHGSGLFVSYIDYITGRKAGYYNPTINPFSVKPPSQESEQNTKPLDHFTRGFYEEAGRTAYRNKLWRS